MAEPNNCYCGHAKSFTDCCELFIKQIKPAITPEAVMRSRYTAFCLKDMSYIVRTTHPKARGGFNREAHQEWADTSEFFKLEILKSSQVGDSGLVEFKAHSRTKGEEKIHHEISSFRREKGIWYFLNGKVIEG